jgi:hypothetical protein
MTPMEVTCKTQWRIHLAQHSVRWRILVNTVKKIWVPWEKETYLTTWAAISYSKSLLLSGVVRRITILSVPIRVRILVLQSKGRKLLKFLFPQQTKVRCPVHAKKTRRRGIAPIILNVGTRWRSLVGFKRRQLKSLWQNPQNPLHRTLGGPQSWSANLYCSGKRKMSLTPWNSKQSIAWLLQGYATLVPFMANCWGKYSDFRKWTNRMIRQRGCGRRGRWGGGGGGLVYNALRKETQLEDLSADGNTSIFKLKVRNFYNTSKCTLTIFYVADTGFGVINTPSSESWH